MVCQISEWPMDGVGPSKSAKLAKVIQRGIATNCTYEMINDWRCQLGWEVFAKTSMASAP